jgi:hypothetical protein
VEGTNMLVFKPSKTKFAVNVVQFFVALLFTYLGHKYVAVLIMLPHFD